MRERRGDREAWTVFVEGGTVPKANKYGAERKKESKMKTKLLVSFSGGRSSAYMAWKIKQEWSELYDLSFVFANTGKEREETLILVER